MNGRPGGILPMPVTGRRKSISDSKFKIQGRRRTLFGRRRFSEDCADSSGPEHAHRKIPGLHIPRKAAYDELDSGHKANN